MKSNPDSSFTDKIFYFFYSLFVYIETIFVKNPRGFVHIRQPIDEYTYEMDGGRLVSVIKLHGSLKTMLFDEYVDVMAAINDALSKYMRAGAHEFEVFYSSEETIASEVDKQFGGTQLTAKALQLNIEDLLDEQRKVMIESCTHSDVFIVLKTNMRGLSKKEREIIDKQFQDVASKSANCPNSQPQTTKTDYIESKHKGFCDVVMNKLSDLSIVAKMVGFDEHMKYVRGLLAPEDTPDNWQPLTRSNYNHLPLNETLEGSDYKSFLPPKIADQILPSALYTDPIEDTVRGIVQVGDRYYAPMNVEYIQREPEPFERLKNRLVRDKVPFRIRFLVTNDRMSTMSTRSTMAAIAGVIPGGDENMDINKVERELKDIRKSNAEVYVVQVCVCTYAPIDNPTLLRERIERVKNALLDWGGCEVAKIEGDLAESLISTLPGVCNSSIGNPATGPVSNIVQMLPFTGTASPWREGAFPTRSASGTYHSYQPVSDNQEAWVKMIVGAMGTGKTMYLNMENFSNVLKPGNTKIPFISNIDIGPGNRGVIQLLREAAPEAKKHYFFSAAIENNKNYLVNIFDLPLGLREPFTFQMDFIVSFLSFLSTPDDRELPIDGTAALVKQVAKYLYKTHSERATANLYIEGENVLVEETLAKSKTFDQLKKKKIRLRWYDVVDCLSRDGFYHAATIAQRYAVPTLPDFATAVRESIFVNQYGKDHCHKIWQKLTDAFSLYPVLEGRTMFDLGEARVVSLDLNNVTQGKSKTAQKQSGVFYSLAFYLLSSKLFTGSDNLHYIPDSIGVLNFNYRKYHENYFSDLTQLSKQLSIDEVHRIGFSQELKNLFDQTSVEGRKWGVSITQASQMPSHFSKNYIKACTDKIILGGSSRELNIEAADVLNLSDSMREELLYHMRGPSKVGSTMIHIAETKQGTMEHSVVCPLAPAFIWAYNSTRRDTYVRNELYKLIGEKQTRKLLVEMYPSGSISEAYLDALERKRQELKGGDVTQMGEEDDTILDDIVKKVLSVHKAKLLVDVA